MRIKRQFFTELGQKLGHSKEKKATPAENLAKRNEKRLRYKKRINLLAKKKHTKRVKREADNKARRAANKAKSGTKA